ncbi:MAG: sodium:solute symporter family protein, partial [Cetobacterium sp.]
LVLTYSSTFFVGPDIYSRIFCAKDSSVAKKSIVASIIILIPLAFILAKIGIYAAGTFPNLTSGQSPLLHVAANTLPKSISLLLYFGLLSAVISSADTSLLTASSIFTEIFTKNLKNIKSIKLTRIFIGVFGLFSILVALKLKFILSSLLLALSVYSGALIIPCFAGILGYRSKKSYVLSAIIMGGTIALFGKIYGGSNSNYILILAFCINAIVLATGRKK